MILEPVNFLIFASVGNGHDNSKDIGTKPIRSIGPSKVASRLREAGYSVQIINFFCHYSYDELIEMTTPYIDKNTVLCVSTTFISVNPHHKKYAKTQIDDLIKVIDHYKNLYNSIVLLGGPSPKLFQEPLKANIVIEGYAENKVVDTANMLFNHGLIKKHLPVWDIKTCGHKWYDSDFIMQNETLPLELGRGCIFKCKYCKFEFLGKKRGEYVRDLSLVKDELIENYEKYNVTNYMIMDDTFNDDSYKLEDWVKMLSDLPFEMQYTAFCRGDLLQSHGELSKELFKSGLKGTSIGIESFNEYASKVVGKAWSGKKAKDFLPKWVHEICEDKSIDQLNFIIGLPKDTIEDVWSWLEWCKSEKIPSVITSPLVITKPDAFPEVKVFSDFDYNAEKLYGYRFKPDSPLFWENENMTYPHAVKTNVKVWNFIEKTFTPGSWTSFSMLSLGYTLDEIRNKTAIEIYNDPLYQAKKKKWFDNYKQLVLGKKYVN